MTQATQATYDAIVDGGLTHTGDPQLVRHFQNCHLKEDARGARIMKDRRGSTKKIDLAVASLIAFHSAANWREEALAESQLLVL
jgi:phage terminase large subunit-like protein